MTTTGGTAQDGAHAEAAEGQRLLGPPSRFAIRNTDTDPWDRLSLEAILATLQEAATEDALAQGFGYRQLDPRQLVWLVSRISVRIGRPLRWGETLGIETWCRHITRLFFDREFRLLDGEGVEVGVANSAWFLVDRASHEPQRPEVLGEAQLRTFARGPWTPVLEAARLRFPPAEGGDGAAPLLTREVGFSDADRNGHVNNSRYAAWCMDALWLARGEEAAGRPLDWRQFDINFVSELRIGERLAIHVSDGAPPSAADGAAGPDAAPELRIEGRADGERVCFRARFSFV